MKAVLQTQGATGVQWSFERLIEGEDDSMGCTTNLVRLLGPELYVGSMDITISNATHRHSTN